LNSFLQYLRRRKIKFIWVLEFQSKGAPHYHIIASDFLPKDEASERWHKIMGSGDEKHLKARTGIASIKSKEQLHGNLLTYIKKLDQKNVPEVFKDVGRFWGSSRGLLAWQLFQKRGHYFRLLWRIKLLRKWYQAHLRKFGIKWRWRGKGLLPSTGFHW
jgi:hypothetical protein